MNIRGKGGGGGGGGDSQTIEKCNKKNLPEDHPHIQNLVPHTFLPSVSPLVGGNISLSLP